ncbi:hypothetical protein B0H10DRAFT_2047482 [Mycena sp. CBHHK59/15]|nr:hypothetical protein B0H10DRAFT_2047482 [Mycena sp. CBHHK59/15]
MPLDDAELEEAEAEAEAVEDTPDGRLPLALIPEAETGADAEALEGRALEIPPEGRDNDCEADEDTPGGRLPLALIPDAETGADAEALKGRALEIPSEGRDNDCEADEMAEDATDRTEDGTVEPLETAFDEPDEGLTDDAPAADDVVEDFTGGLEGLGMERDTDGTDLEVVGVGGLEDAAPALLVLAGLAEALASS